MKSAMRQLFMPSTHMLLLSILPWWNNLHCKQDWTRHATNVEAKLKIIHIHMSDKLASIKWKNCMNEMFKASLFEFYFIKNLANWELSTILTVILVTVLINFTKGVYTRLINLVSLDSSELMFLWVTAPETKIVSSFAHILVCNILSLIIMISQHYNMMLLTNILMSCYLNVVPWKKPKN